MNNVEWREIYESPGYFVSVNGAVMGPRHMMKPVKHPQGYLMVSLGRRQRFLIHRLVLLAFVGPCPPSQECRHLNGIKTDNRLENLSWGTRKENCADKKGHGTENNGERNGGAKVDAPTVCAIRASRASMPELAEATGLSTTQIRRIVSGVKWSHLPLSEQVTRLHANRGERNGQSKLTADQVVAIRSNSQSLSVAGKIFGVSPTTIRKIRKREKWAHLNP